MTSRWPGNKYMYSYLVSDGKYISAAEMYYVLGPDHPGGGSLSYSSDE